MPRSTAEQRELWRDFECAEDRMVTIPFGPDRIRVAPPTADAWQALVAVLEHHGYKIRTADTDSYNCRAIKNGTEKSLHAFGIALDVNWNTNPWRDHPGKRTVRFTDKPTQAERAEDVRLGIADTDMTEAMIDDVKRIRTKGNLQVFEWGGHWPSVKDCMHFEIDVSPEELAKGIDTTTVNGWDAFLAHAAAPAPEGAATASKVNPLPAATPVVGAEMIPPPARADPHVVIARNGLNLRAGPSTDFPVDRTLPAGTLISVISRQDGWAQVDLQGDGLADGFVSLNFLRSAPATAIQGGATIPAAAEPPMAPLASPPRVAASLPDILDDVTPAIVKRMFPATGIVSITANLPFVLDGLRAHGMVDRDMVLMALSTIRAETEGFVPIDEFVSRFNTRDTPFDLYDAGTQKGQNLGNVTPGDGPRFKGRGYIQLTGRHNYSRIGAELGEDLVRRPELANDPRIAGLVLARFLFNKQQATRDALAAGDLPRARKLVNGGTHGFERFKDAFDRGLTAIIG